MPWQKFCPIWGGFGYKLLTKRMMVSVGNVQPLGRKQYPLPLIAFKYFSRVNIEQHECYVNFVIFRGSSRHFYALTEVSMHLCE